MATLVTRDEGGQDVREPGTDPVTEARRVVEPDLLWIESVTDRLLGTAGRPAAWERVYFEGREDATAGGGEPQASEPAVPEPQAPAVEPGAGDPAAVTGESLPQRLPRSFDGPVSYRQPAGYVPSPILDPLTQTPPAPAAAAEDHGVSEAEPDRQEPALSAEPSPVDLAPTGPHLQQVPPAPPAPEPPHAEASRGEEMPPAVLRAALRNALPDVLGVPASSGPADAVFGDPRWNLPAEEADDAEPTAVAASAEPPEQVALPEQVAPPEPAAPAPPADQVAGAEPADQVAPASEVEQPQQPEQPEQVLPPEPVTPAAHAERITVAAGRSGESGDAAPDLAGDDADRLRAAAAEEPEGPGEAPFADEPVQEPYFEPAPARPRTPPPYAHLGYGFPRPSDQLTVADVALRLAFRSEDRELAEAVVRLVAGQARERARLQTAEAYLDAILDEGDAALPGAARLRRILAD